MPTPASGPTPSLTTPPPGVPGGASALGPSSGKRPCCTIICGGRRYMLTPADFARLDAIHADPNTRVSEVVSGASEGADAGGEAWALAHGIPVKRFHADWLHRGRAAGPIRNAEMAAYVGPAGGCVAFPGGKGTADMVRKATAAGMRVWDWRGAT